MSKHTPGPWFYRKSKDGSEFAVYSDESCTKDSIITYGGCGCCNASDESIALEEDATLIAAAPDLLEALEGMLEVYGVYDQHLYREPFSRSVEVELCNQARAAIARAKGESL